MGVTRRRPSEVQACGVESFEAVRQQIARELELVIATFADHRRLSVGDGRRDLGDVRMALGDGKR